MKTTKNTTWNQKLYSISYLRNRIRYIFKNAKENQLKHIEIVESITLEIYSDQKYKTLPNYMKSEIKGYIYANFDLMWELMEWVHWYDNKFVGKNLPYGNNFKQELINESTHVYKGTQKRY